jgi:hypothetical protein
MRYATATAFRQALDDRLKAEAAKQELALDDFHICRTACELTASATFPTLTDKVAIDLPTSDYFNTPKVQRALPACEALRTGEPFVLAAPVPWTHSQR